MNEWVPLFSIDLACPPFFPVPGGESYCLSGLEGQLVFRLSGEVVQCYRRRCGFGL